MTPQILDRFRSPSLAAIRPTLLCERRVARSWNDVRVQPGRVGRRGEAREHVAVAIARIGEERQDLVAMAREHDFVEPHRRPIPERHRHASSVRRTE
jgi:hypothetical protein